MLWQPMHPERMLGLTAYSFIYPPTIPWGPAFQRPQQLLRALARLGHRGIFCQTPKRDGVESPGEIEPGLLITQSWEEILKQQLANPVLWISYPRHWRLAGPYPGNPFLAFDLLDEPVDEFKHWLKGYEKMIQMADSVFVCSDRLLSLVQGAHSRVHVVRNAAEYEHFAPVAQDVIKPHGDLAVEGPVIGFIGAIATWVDIQLIRRMALRRPGWIIAMIGKVTTDVTSLSTCSNVLFLGEKPYEVLPRYMAAFDVAIVPFQVRNMTHSANPIKMYEYLAAGLPVVATPIAECRGLEPLVYTAGDSRGFIHAIEKAIPERRNEDMVNRRLGFASQNTWENRARDIVAAIDAHYETALKDPSRLSPPRKRPRIREYRR